MLAVITTVVLLILAIICFYYLGEEKKDLDEKESIALVIIGSVLLGCALTIYTIWLMPFNGLSKRDVPVKSISKNQESKTFEIIYQTNFPENWPQSWFSAPQELIELRPTTTTAHLNIHGGFCRGFMARYVVYLPINQLTSETITIWRLKEP